jgi:hypothetical protein
MLHIVARLLFQAKVQNELKAVAEEGCLTPNLRHVSYQGSNPPIISATD